MRIDEVQIGKVYEARINRCLVAVRVEEERMLWRCNGREHRGFLARNLRTKRIIVLTAARLRRLLPEGGGQ